MARFEIKSKDGQSARFSGKPVYNGSYLKPSSLTFSEINSPSPISWEVGDYVDYTRTGMRYYLYSIPQPSKNANRGTRGDAFSYSGVQFFAATKELEIALFKDIVATDNGIHFSTNPDVSTFENVEGIARRIQACMDYFFPDRWEIRLADFDAVADAEVLEKINTAKDFVLSGGTCLDALSRIYELWQDIGWIHTNENGKEVIIIGYSNKRIDENTSDAYLYGKGRGLTALRKTQTNKEEFATRLYVYGSERNLPSRFYNSKDIHNAESVDIRNLMLPLNKWGQTDGKPDASKAYLENAEAVAKYGLIPKTHYFDSEDAGADIYPTISGMTIGKIREALTALGQTDSAYFPSAELYPDASQRVDKVRWCDNPDDHGDVGDVLLNGSPSMFDGETKSVDVSSGTRTANIVENKLMASAEFSYSESRTCKVRFSTAVSGYVNDDGFESVVVKMRLSDSNNANSSMSKVVEYPAVLNGGKWEFTLPSVEYDYGQIPKTIFGAYAFLTIAVTLPSGSKDKSISYVLNTGIQHLDLYLIMEKTFLLRLHEIGFDIDKQASLGKGKVISMKTGACAGRSFVIESCRHKGGIYTQGYWDLILKRQKDNTLGLMFPNVNAQIVEGDEFVLTDIAMPELYVQAAMLRLLSEGQKLLTRASSIQNLYEPSIDAKVMVEQGRTLREGMFMEISDADVVDNTTEYILIDTLSIHEDESAIPTYKVTLKERRKVTYKGTPSATSTDNTESVEDDVQTEVNIDLSEYAKKAEVEEVSELLSTMWQLEGDTIVATKDVRIKANLIVEQDTSSGGEGQDTPGAGLDEDEVLDIVKGYTYSKSEINKLIDDVNAGDVDLTNYYTKDEVDAKIPSLDGYAKEGYVDDAITALNLSQYAKGSDLETLQGEVDNIESVLGLEGEIEGVIDTWNEVKAFLDGYSHSDDLATILSNMNADIATRALDSDLDKLEIRVKAEEDVTTTYGTWWADLKKYIKVEGSNVKIDTNLIVTGDTSSGGSGQDTPASGTVTGIKVSASETLTPNNAGIIDMVSVLSSIDVSDQLTAYAKTEDVNAALLTKQDTISDLATIRDGASKGATALQSITKSMVTDALGYTPLSTGGGTIEGGSNVYTPLAIKNTNLSEVWIEFQDAKGICNIGSSNGVPSVNTGGANLTILHSGNYSSYALPLSGGTRTLTSTDNTVLVLKTDGWHSFINLQNNHGSSISVGYYSGRGAQISNGSNYLSVGDDGVPYFNTNTLIHSGNIGEYALPTSNNISAGYGQVMAVGYGKSADGWPHTGPAISFGKDGYCLLLQQEAASHKLRVSYKNAGTTNSDWKTIAFTDSNVASATKLATARTIWGQSFDGTGNVSGLISSYSPTGSDAGMDAKNDSYSMFFGVGTGVNRGIYDRTNGGWLLYRDSTLNVLFPHGNVLIGTTTDSGYKLDVNGTGRFTGAVTMSSTLSVGGNTILGGATNWGNTLDLKGNMSIQDGFLLFGGSGTSNNMYLSNQDAAGFNFRLSTGATRLFLANGGNVGIGTTNPEYKLDVDGIINTNNHVFSKYGYRLTGGTSGLCGLFAEEFIGGNINADLWLYTTSKANIYAPSGVNITGAVTMSSTLSVGGNTTINGNLVVSGDTSSGSDIRFKDIIKNKTLKIADIAKAPLFTFKWNDRDDDAIHLGSSAQYWEKVCPWLVKGEDFKTLDYSTLGVAMGISLAKKAVNHEARIKVLEKENKALKEEIRRMQYGS